MQQVEAEKLAKRLRMMCWLGEEGNELLAEAVEILGEWNPSPQRIDAWLRRVGKAVAGIAEEQSDGS